MNVKIHGAGSIGNHLAQAARRMGWDVCVIDPDPQALERMKTDIYPTRYGSWDEGITLYQSGSEPKGDFDIICIGTPPHVRMPIALAALEEEPRVLLLEKPLTHPFDSDLRTFLDRYRSQSTTLGLVGYDHAVAASIERVSQLVSEKKIGTVLTLDVEFREHWQGIFNAHPWLSGPADTYLGFWKRGGGAGGEHSHALHLWQHLAKVSSLGRWSHVSPMLEIHTEGEAEYDTIAAFQLRTESGRVGRVVQDVVTKPPRKWARLQGEQGYIEWLCNGHPDGDLIRYTLADGKEGEEIFAKKRPDDFHREMLHIDALLRGECAIDESPLSLETGVEVMRVLETAWTKPGEGERSLIVI